MCVCLSTLKSQRKKYIVITAGEVQFFTDKVILSFERKFFAEEEGGGDILLREINMINFSKKMCIERQHENEFDRASARGIMSMEKEMK